MPEQIVTLATAAAALSRHLGISGAADVSAVAAEPGAYLLLLELSGPIRPAIAAFSATELPPGPYVYAGSARGPGGLKARLARHLRRQKKRHWHIDHLTGEASSMLAFAVPGGNECALVRSLLESGRYHQPLPGFGSSDCRTCTSHLLAPN